MSSLTFYIIFVLFIAFVLLAINLIFAPSNPYQEKNSAFECGFHSFLGQNRTQFSISFFIFALLFLLFDLEILLVYPYVVSAYSNGVYGLLIMLIFFLVLTLGFAFELGKKALNIDTRQSSFNSSKDTIFNVMFTIENLKKSFSNKRHYSSKISSEPAPNIIDGLLSFLNTMIYLFGFILNRCILILNTLKFLINIATFLFTRICSPYLNNLFFILAKYKYHIFISMAVFTIILNIKNTFSFYFSLVILSSIISIYLFTYLIDNWRNMSLFYRIIIIFFLLISISILLYSLGHIIDTIYWIYTMVSRGFGGQKQEKQEKQKGCLGGSRGSGGSGGDPGNSNPWGLPINNCKRKMTDEEKKKERKERNKRYRDKLRADKKRYEKAAETIRKYKLRKRREAMEQVDELENNFWIQLESLKLYLKKRDLDQREKQLSKEK